MLHLVTRFFKAVKADPGGSIRIHQDPLVSIKLREINLTKREKTDFESQTRVDSGGFR